MLAKGEMCLLLPNNIRSNLFTLMNYDPLRVINNMDFMEMPRKSVPRCLFDNISDNINNNDENKNTVNNIDFAEKLLNEQLSKDRERFISRYNFDILSDESFGESDFSSSFSSDTTTPVKTDPKVRLDENVNEINTSNSFDDEKNSSLLVANASLSDEDSGKYSSLSTSPEMYSPRTPASPTKSKTCVEFRRHPYSSPKQSHLTDYWKIRRRSVDQSSTKLISDSTTKHVQTQHPIGSFRQDLSLRNEEDSS